MYTATFELFITTSSFYVDFKAINDSNHTRKSKVCVCVCVNSRMAEHQSLLSGELKKRQFTTVSVKQFLSLPEATEWVK